MRSVKPSRVLVCLLVVNKIDDLPVIAVQSILEFSESDILIGYIDERDLQKLPKNSRISFVNLQSQDSQIRNGTNQPKYYSDWNDQNFYDIIKLKWELLIYALSLSYSFIIYSDIDVIWLSDAAQVIQATFEKRDYLNLQIQSFTYASSSPKLCMGFIALRSNEYSERILLQAKKRHWAEAKNNPRIGDDEIITLLYEELGYPYQFLELPQFRFPVGEGLNLLKKSRFPGLNMPTPYIFHANYVVGLRNKRLLLRLALSRKLRRKFKVRMSIYWFFVLVLKQVLNITRIGKSN
jgi:hypothetical protein